MPMTVTAILFAVVMTFWFGFDHTFYPFLDLLSNHVRKYALSPVDCICSKTMLSLIELLAGSNLTEFTVNLSTIFYTNKYKRIYKIENMKGGQPYFMQNTKYKRYNLKKKNLVNPSISFYTKIQNIKLQSFQ